MSPEAFAIQKVLKIVDKQQVEQDFVLNPIQAQLDEALTGRDLIPKARREGVSMYFLARNLVKCLAVPNTVAVVISHEKDATVRMLDRVKWFMDNMKTPPPAISVSNRDEIIFSKTNSRFFIGTAGSRTFGRGDGITDLHCSEIAFWPDQKALANSLFDAAQGGRISVESTGNGAGDFYHSMCMRAARGNGRFRLHFLPWYKFPEYTVPVTEDHAEHIIASLDEDFGEPDLVRLYGVTPGQILWRRQVLEEKDYDIQLVNQEYPTTLSDCFQASGAGIFYKINYHETKDWERRDQYLWALRGHPIKGRRYVVGGDVGGGVHRDSSVLEVFDVETHEQVAEWSSNRVPPDVFAVHAAAVARQFNFAYISVESNNHGILTNAELRKIYPAIRVHNQAPLNRRPDEATRLADVGQRVTVRNRPFIIGKLRKMASTSMVVHSPILKGEMDTFVEHDDGSMSAQKGAHDDTVLAAGHAMYVLERAAMADPDVFDNGMIASRRRLGKVDPFSFEGILKELDLKNRFTRSHDEEMF